MTNLTILIFTIVALVDLNQAYKVVYFDQTLDHFGELSFKDQTFKQKVIVDESYLRYTLQPRSNVDTAPIFLYTGNEGPIDGFYAASGFIMELASTFNALVVFAEHRFYGESLPFGDNSFDRPDILSSLLTVDQAVADFASVIVSLKKQYAIPNAPVICFGGSYGGMLSAYMRFKFPNLVDGALAASAPVKMADSDDVRRLFWSSATEDYRQVSQEAVDKVKEGFAQMDQLAANGSEGYRELSNQFKLCNPINNDADYKQLLYTIRNAFVEITMFDYPYQVSFSSSLPAWPVKNSSQLILDADSAIEGLFKVTNLVYNGTDAKLDCFDPYVLYIACADPTGCGLGNAAKAWDFQTCYQINLAFGSTGKDDMFPNLPWSDEDRDAYCMAKYNITGQHDWFAINFWGSNIWSSSNIIWSNGLLDPWHNAGILKAHDKSYPIVIIPSGAHHLDLRSSNAADPQDVTKARRQEMKIISNLLKQLRKERKYASVQ